MICISWWTWHGKYVLKIKDFSGKIIQESDPSLWWVLANVCLRPGQNKKAWM